MDRSQHTLRHHLSDRAGLFRSEYIQYCTTAPSPPAATGSKPELASQFAEMMMNINTTTVVSSRTSASPFLEVGRTTVSRSSVETIWLKSRNSPGREGLDLSFTESGSERSGKCAERGKE